MLPRPKAAVAAAPADADEEEGEGEAVAETEDEPISEAVVEGDDFDAEDLETESMPLAAEEDTASEVLRDLIATWNVPAWDDIVGGLYRPN